MVGKTLPPGKTPEELKAQRKECQRCKFVKTGLGFYRDKKSADGLQNWCKLCMRITTNRITGNTRK